MPTTGDLLSEPAGGALLDQEYELVDTDSLHRHPDNPRTGDVALIAESVAVNGFYGALVVQTSTRRVLAGNHRLLAAREHGIAQVPVVWVDVDDDEARRILLVDNRSNDLAHYDETQLAALLGELSISPRGLAGTGYSAEDLHAAGNDVPAALNDPDEAPEAPQRPFTEPGDVWLLGPHRVACGDAMDGDLWKRLVADQPPVAVWTDPPYGVAYVGKTSDALTISNDGTDLNALADLLRGACSSLLSVCQPGAAWYVAAPAGPATGAFATVLAEMGLWRQTLVWVKDQFVMGHSDYHYRHEIIYMGYGPKTESGRRGRGGDGWYGPNNVDTVFEIPRPKVSRIHPTMKPVDLIIAQLANSAPAGAVVADPFGGSGSTLIACHATRRLARLTELDPHYVDVICRRYEEHTGTVPVLQSTGEPHSFVSQEEASVDETRTVTETDRAPAD